MPRPRDELTAGEWALLALLAEEPAHGFALARAMAPEGDVGRVWALRRPLVYRAVAQLTERRLVSSGKTVPSPEGPHRTQLKATAEIVDHRVESTVASPVTPKEGMPCRSCRCVRSSIVPSRSGTESPA